MHIIDKPMVKHILNFCALRQKFRYLICLISKTKQVTHEKVDHLPEVQRQASTHR